jgi:hypothetical protein
MADDKLALVNQETGELIEQRIKEKVESGPIDLYRGASCKAVTQKQQDILLSPIDPNDVEIKPEGSPYYPQIKYRRRLNQAFGPMGWALLPANELSVKGNILYRKYVLMVGDRYVAEAIGSQKYFENNDNMDYADAAEGVKSNAMERCCKDLGIASELWDPVYVNQWKQDCAVEVKAPVKGQIKEVWRRKDRPPFKGEGGAAPTSTTVTNTQTSAPQQSADPSIISDPQRKRMYAIAKNAQYSDDLFKKMLSDCGYHSSTEVKKKHYETIIEFIEGTPVEQVLGQIESLAKWCKEN